MPLLLFQFKCDVEPRGENVVCVEAVPNSCCPISTVGTSSMGLFPFVTAEGCTGARTPVVALPMLHTSCLLRPFLSAFREMT